MLYALNYASALGMIAVGIATMALPLRWFGPPGRFQVKWAPAHRPETRQNNKLEPFRDSMKSGMAPWRTLLLGAGFWVVTVGLKFAWAIPFNAPILVAMAKTFGTPIATSVFPVYVGSLTGIFECGLVWLALRLWPRLRPNDYGPAFILGAGFGGIEALLIGLGALVSLVWVIAFPQTLPEAVTSQLQPISALLAPAASFERLMAVAVHIATTLMVVFALVSARMRWFWAAFVFKSALDSVAAWAQLSYGLETTAKVWTIEAIIAVFGAISVYVIIWLKRNWPAIPIQG